jgi:hypothetical protein
MKVSLMRTSTIIGTFVVVTVALGAGCRSGKDDAGMSRDVRPQGHREPEKKPVVYTASNNPTTLAGRGLPTLDDQFRPAAWILIDGLEGRYVEVNGNPHLEWVIDRPVSATPEFRVEVFKPLLGAPDGFKAVLQSIATVDGSRHVYGLAADSGVFRPGQCYSLTNPGSGFTLRNLMTGEVVRSIGPLPPGRYAFAGGIRNSDTGAETPAVTFFTVGP